MNQQVTEKVQFDVMVIGGGIAGCESALNLANVGYKVVLVEKDLSIGGKMILLSKVFPTLDCAACITTPKVSEIMRHPNITVWTSAQAESIKQLDDGSFYAQVLQQPRYVKIDDCTGCQLCEDACPVSVVDEYQFGLIGRKAAFIPFSIASPRVAAIDIDNCTLCGACERVCPTDAIDFTQKPILYQVSARAVIIATGFQLFDPTVMPRYGYGKYKNVLTSMQMERQLAPTRPFNTVLRPSDGKIPDNIAYVLCTGSRDHTVGNPICSRVCCMYSMKQAQLILGALPMADVTLYYIDIRAFGKGFNQFYRQAKAMGVEFVKGKVAKITEKDNGNLILRYEDINDGGVVKEAEHDLVVLSVGILPNRGIERLFVNRKLQLDEYNYVAQPNVLLNPAQTSIPGVFVAGVASGPMDIPDSILSAGAASSEAAKYIKQLETKTVTV